MKDRFQDGTWLSTPKRHRTRWTLYDAQELLVSLSSLVKNEGWGVSLYGTVLLKGMGQDLDLLLTPSHPDAMDMFDLALVIPQVGLSPVGIPGYGHRRDLGVVSWSWEDDKERLVDMAFWPIIVPDAWRFVQRPKAAADTRGEEKDA